MLHAGAVQWAAGHMLHLPSCHPGAAMSSLPLAIRRLALLGAVGGGGYYAWQEYTQPHEEEVKTIKLQVSAAAWRRRPLRPGPPSAGRLALAAPAGPVASRGLMPLRPLAPQERVPTREEQLTRLRAATRDAPYDVIIIGGGATGAGCAVDAATR